MDNRINKSREQLEKRVADLAIRFPEAGLTFGYIGNCGRDYDDRGWYVFSQVRKDGYGARESFGGWGTKELPFFALAAKANLERWVQRITNNVPGGTW